MKWFTISVLMCVIGKCFSMSVDELQDFSNYLKEKSLLDQPLKKNPVEENDEDDPISDHAWEESGRFEGDLILNDRQRQLIVQDVAEGLSRNGIKDSTKRWPDNEVIYYIQKEHFTDDQVQAILNGIDDLAQASCIKFRPYRKGDRDAVVVQGSRRGCFSQVGYQGGYQVLNLSGRHPVGRGCFRHGTVVHEFLHTLGFYHMQSSADRDDYIDVLWENIVQPARHNFRKYNLFSVTDFGVGYDYDSVLHYSRKAFSSNGGDTLVPKKSGVDIGQRAGLSDKDTVKLNKMYCDADSNNSDAAEPLHKPVIRKKKPKNKPFEGHGIGYHQGKTVSIKLPAVETYRLPDKPSYQVFDYFSKAPQAMSPSLIEGFGIGKKITYYALPTVFKTYEQKVPVLYSGPPRPLNTVIQPHTKVKTTTKQESEVRAQPGVNNNKSKETIEDLDEKVVKSEDKKTGRQDFYDAFNKLGEVFKSKIHPDLYKPNKDYREFYNPVKSQPVTTRTDYYLNYVPSSEGVNDHTSEDISKEVPNFKRAQKFIETLNGPRLKDSLQSKKHDPYDHDKHESKREIEPETESKTYDEQKSREVDITFGKIYPHTKLQEIKSIYSLKPEYTSLKYLDNRQDYTNYYNPNDRNKGNSETQNSQYTLLGEPVPVTASWPQKYKRNDPPERQSNSRDIFNYRDKQKDVDRSESEEDSSSENVESTENPESQRKFKRPVSQERSTSSYEVTERIKEQVETVTEKHVLKDRLPKILEGYTKFDDFDISSPYVSSEYDASDASGESNEKEESSEDYAEY